MNTFLGAAQLLPVDALDEAQIAGRRDALSRRLSLGSGDAALRDDQGDRRRPPAPAARSPSPCPTPSASTATATASTQLIDGGKIDILFANEAEIQALAGVAHFDERGGGGPGQGRDCSSSPAARRARSRSPAASAPRCRPSRSTGSSTRPAPATCSPPASWPAGRRAGASRESLRIGAIAAAEVISHYGARPEKDLKALVAERLG